MLHYIKRTSFQTEKSHKLPSFVTGPFLRDNCRFFAIVRQAAPCYLSAHSWQTGRSDRVNRSSRSGPRSPLQAGEEAELQRGGVTKRSLVTRATTLPTGASKATKTLPYIERLHRRPWVCGNPLPPSLRGRSINLTRRDFWVNRARQSFTVKTFTDAGAIARSLRRQGPRIGRRSNPPPDSVSWHCRFYRYSSLMMPLLAPNVSTSISICCSMRTNKFDSRALFWRSKARCP